MNNVTANEKVPFSFITRVNVEMMRKMTSEDIKDIILKDVKSSMDAHGVSEPEFTKAELLTGAEANEKFGDNETFSPIEDDYQLLYLEFQVYKVEPAEIEFEKAANALTELFASR